MDVFHWFRQKRQGSSKGGRPRATAPPTQVRIPLDTHPTVGFVVYFSKRDDAPLPTDDDLAAIVRHWLKNHAEGVLGETLRDFVGQNGLELSVHEREEVPHPPDELVMAYNPGETEERRYRNASHLVFVGATDALLPPRVGLWAATGAARALAAGLPGGVILDPEFPRLLPLSVRDEDVPANGALRVPEHILIPYSHDPRSGLLWMTTRGMGRFGLPELEIRNVPPNLSSHLMPIMNGMAQHLMEAAMRYAGESNPTDPPDVLPLQAEIRFTIADVRRAYSEGDDEGGEDDSDGDNEGGVTTIRLGVSGRQTDSPFVRLSAPHDSGMSAGVWLNALLGDLLGSSPEIAAIETGDADMEAAHLRAVADLPLVKSRFRLGFRSGEVLHIKHGFPTENDGHEYMWLAVTQWSEDGTVRGTLANDPQYRFDLRAGQSVEVGEDDVYDYLIVHLDGRTEGAFTNRVLQAQEGDGDYSEGLE